MGLPKIDDKKLAQYVDGELSPSEVLIVEEALRKDPIARQKVRALVITGHALKSSLGRLTPPEATEELLRKIEAKLQDRRDLSDSPPFQQDDDLPDPILYGTARHWGRASRESGRYYVLNSDSAEGPLVEGYLRETSEFAPESVPLPNIRPPEEALNLAASEAPPDRHQDRKQILIGLGIGLALGGAIAIGIVFLL